MADNKVLYKVRYVGESDPLYFINGKLYDVIGEEEGYLRIIDETNDDYLYEPDDFEVVDKSSIGK